MDVDTVREDIIKIMESIKKNGGRLFLSPFTPRSKKQLLCYNFIYFLVLFTSIQLFYTLCLTKFKDFMEIISIAPNIGACLMSLIKYTTINKNKDFYNKIYQHFYFNSWDLILDRSTENFEIFFSYTKVSKMLNKLIAFLCFTLIFVVDSFPWLLMTYENRILGKDSPYLYPFDAWYPFDKVKWYWPAYIWEGVMTGIVILLYGFSNKLHLSYVAFICMELQLLGNRLKTLITKEDIQNIIHEKNLNKTHNKIKNNLKFIIKRYAFLDEISSGLDNILGDSMLVAYIFGAIFICLTAFSFIVIDELYQSVRYFSFFLSLLFEMFNQCIIGQVLIDHSVALTEKIYCSDWTYADAETKKIILMLILRTQRPFKLTAKGFVTMNLNTFSQICSSSFQLFNLLRTLYEKSI